MDVSQLLPYLLGGGAISGFILALRWGRQDARDSVDAASSNTSTAMSLRDGALAELERVRQELATERAERIAAQVECARLLAMLRRNGLDPGEVQA